jgi:hypothetical protein
MRALQRPRDMAQALLDAGRCDRLMGNFKGAEDQYGKALKLLEAGQGGQKIRKQDPGGHPHGTGQQPLVPGPVPGCLSKGG